MNSHKGNLLLFILALFSISPLFSQENGQAEKDSLFKVGMHYFDYSEKIPMDQVDSFDIYRNKALKYFLASNNWDYVVYCYTSMAANFFSVADYANFSRCNVQANRYAKAHLEANSEAAIYVSNNMSLEYKIKGNFEKSVALYKETYNNVISKQNDPWNLFQISYNLGNALRNKGDISEAILYLEDARKYYAGTVKLDSTIYAKIYYALGNCYKDQNQLDTALSLYDQSLLILSREKEENFKIRKTKINCYHEIAEINLSNKKLDAVKAYIDRVLTIQESKKPFRKSYSLELLGKYYFAKNDLAQAKSTYKQAIQQARKEYKAFEQHPQIAKKIGALAHIYFTEQRWEDALTQYQRALQMLSLVELSDDYYQLPEQDQLIAKLTSIEVLQQKAKTFEAYHKSEAQLKDLLAAFDHYMLATKLLQELRQSYQASGSKQFLAQNNQQIYEGAIRTSVQLFQIQKDQKYLEHAFHFAESNKAITLLESINDNSAKGMANIPDSLQEREKDLRIDLAFYERIITEEKQKGQGASEKKIKSWDKELFKLRRAYDSLIKSFEEDYPQYHQLKYQTQLASLEAVQKEMLESNHALLEYFVGDEHLYVFQIDQQQIRVWEKAISPKLEGQIQRFRQLLQNPPRSESFEENFRQYTTLAHELYQYLLATPLEQLSSKAEHLIIVPDGQLNFIPFDLLISKKANTTKANYLPSNLDYLFEDYAISYSYSTTLLQRRSRARKKANQPFIGFAPSFGKEIAQSRSGSCRIGELYSLQCNQSEVEAIHQLFAGTSQLDQNANKASFEQMAQDYQIIHLATHACIDEDNAQLNKIFFSDDYLATADLYNLQLNADLVVLSACNTGSGQLVRGEGVMSLARGFIHAGCPSTVMSLWSVDDCTTSQMMLYFYQALQQKQQKDEAIRQAKLDYLSEVTDPSMAHPYYWAAFVQFGETAPLALNHFNWYWPLLIGLVFLVFSMLFRSKLQP
ncbi:MAG: CHAT domain-containing protein [Bacteroidota bacterium]